jgi:hypothetical protein
LVAALLGGQLFMKLAAAIVGSLAGDAASSARHPRFYTKVRHFGGLFRKLAGPIFNSENREPPVDQGQFIQPPALTRFST